MKLYDRPHYTLDEHFTVSNLHSLSRAEFVLHLRSFYSILLIMTINENSYILYDDPLFPTTAEIPIKMYQRVPISDLRIGRNSFALKAIRIFDDLSVRETIIYEIELKLAN